MLLYYSDDCDITYKIFLLLDLISDVTMSASRTFLSATRLVKIPNRGKALENWARPSIDELGVPTEAWAPVHAKVNQKGWIHLLAGIGLMGGAMLAFSQNVFMNPTPKHLLKNE